MLWKMSKETVYLARTRNCGERGMGGELNNLKAVAWNGIKRWEP